MPKEDYTAIMVDLKAISGSEPAATTKKVFTGYNDCMRAMLGASMTLRLLSPDEPMLNQEAQKIDLLNREYRLAKQRLNVARGLPKYGKYGEYVV